MNSTPAATIDRRRVLLLFLKFYSNFSATLQ